MLSISEVQVVPVKPKDGLVAIVSFVLNDYFYIGSIAVYTKLGGGYRLLYPTKRVGNRQLPIHHPITKDAGEFIESALLNKVEYLLSNNTPSS